jgi:hypothetical protein
MGFTAQSRKKLIVQKSNTRRSRTDRTEKRPRHVKRKNDVRFATWNVLSLFRPGAFKRLKEQLDKKKPEGKRKSGDQEQDGWTMWRQTSGKWDLEDGGERRRIDRNGTYSLTRPRPFKGCNTME